MGSVFHCLIGKRFNGITTLPPRRKALITLSTAGPMFGTTEIEAWCYTAK